MGSFQREVPAIMKINNKDVYKIYSATEVIAEYACSLRQYGDLTVLN